ncbi:unnamed protein product [Polarella glacialis]|uniref:Uncharacterized protein n=1 Tax=Polarella glacialis TaxID=89957 RepID=A0A813GB65_POLGL|nr:unnamed protein product [Polarella glacialis]
MAWFHYGDEIGACECSSHTLQVRPDDGSTLWQAINGTCLESTRRLCEMRGLISDKQYQARLQTNCLNETYDSNWFYAGIPWITLPACKWTYDSSWAGGGSTEFQCMDTTFCDISDPSCCNSRGGRMRCPKTAPIMCSLNHTDCAGDFCCVSDEASCAPSYGAARLCTRAFAPSKAPKIIDYDSYLAASLQITWNRGKYLSGVASPCKFSYWFVEVALSNPDGSLEPWVYATPCQSLGSQDFVCTLSTSIGLISMTDYVVRMKEMCVRDYFSSEYSFLTSPVTTWPWRAHLPPSLAVSNVLDYTFQAAWTAGQTYQRHVQECTFREWELAVQLLPRAVAYSPDGKYEKFEPGSDWYVNCITYSRTEMTCGTAGLDSDRDYSVRQSWQKHLDTTNTQHCKQRQTTNKTTIKQQCCFWYFWQPCQDSRTMYGYTCRQPLPCLRPDSPHRRDPWVPWLQLV